MSKRLVDPSLEHVAVLEEPQLTSYLRANRLVSYRTHERDLLVVVREEIATVLRTIEGRDDTILLNSRSKLRERFGQELSAGKRVLFDARKNVIRDYFSTAGFVAEMNSLSKELAPHIVIVPPGLYGDRHLFAMSPAGSDWR